jgi:hypothetical protein
MNDNLSDYQFKENKGAEHLASNRFTIHVGDVPRMPDLSSNRPLSFSTPMTYPHMKSSEKSSRLYLVDNEAEPTTQTIRHLNKAHTEPLVAQKVHSAMDTGSMASKFNISSSSAKKDRVVDNPNSSHPQMQAYIDYSHTGPDSIYIHMMRSQQHGYHHARNLALKLSEIYPNHSIDFGQMLNKHIVAIKDELEARGHKVSGYLQK